MKFDLKPINAEAEKARIKINIESRAINNRIEYLGSNASSQCQSHNDPLRIKAHLQEARVQGRQTSHRHV